MATAADWVEGARIKTLPASASPVLAGTAVAIIAGRSDVLLASLALVVALAMQLGVNYANDYSDGIRGSDANRVGPKRLVGSGAAVPSAVKAMAFAWFGVAAVAGLIIVLLTQHWWLIALGASCIIAAWFYTGGRHPYGYAGLGEVSVFIFFGVVAVCGTVYIQIGTLNWGAALASIAMGSLSCSILTANNLRDLESDKKAGKHTLPTRLGDLWTRVLFIMLLVVTAASLIGFAVATNWWTLLSLVSMLLLMPVGLNVRAGAKGMALVQVLKRVGTGQLLAASGLILGALASSFVA